MSQLFGWSRQQETRSDPTAAATGSIGHSRSDLTASTELGVRASRRDGRAAPRAGARVTPAPGILGALGELGSVRTEQAVKAAEISNEAWRNLATEVDVQPDLIAQARSVGCIPRSDERLLCSGLSQASAQESFKVLCQRLVQIRRQRRLQTVLVTSSVPREGKTVIAINLAASLAHSSQSVLLVDADLRHPERPRLGIGPCAGLADYLAGAVGAGEAILQIESLGLYFTPAGISSASPTELFQGARLQQFVTHVAITFDWVIIDAPSINQFADARYLASVVDGVVLVAREGVTPKELAMKSLAALDNAFLVGLVFNASTGSRRTC